MKFALMAIAAMFALLIVAACEENEPQSFDDGQSDPIGFGNSSQ